jgi:hypothetical protein
VSSVFAVSSFETPGASRSAFRIVGIRSPLRLEADRENITRAMSSSRPAFSSAVRRKFGSSAITRPMTREPRYA